MIIPLPIVGNPKYPEKGVFSIRPKIWQRLADMAAEALLRGESVNPANLVGKLQGNRLGVVKPKEIVRRNRRANLSALREFYASIPDAGSRNQGGLMKWEREHANELVSPPWFEGAEFDHEGADRLLKIMQPKPETPQEKAPQRKVLIGVDAEEIVEEIRQKYIDKPTSQVEVGGKSVDVSPEVLAVLADDYGDSVDLSDCESLDSLADNYDDMNDDYIRTR